MSLVTRCPACGTSFKVVRDQLRISDGWVRCGRCNEVFDANEALSEVESPAVPAVPGPAPAIAPVPAPIPAPMSVSAASPSPPSEAIVPRPPALSFPPAPIATSSPAASWPASLDILATPLSPAAWSAPPTAPAAQGRDEAVGPAVDAADAAAPTLAPEPLPNAWPAADMLELRTPAVWSTRVARAPADPLPPPQAVLSDEPWPEEMLRLRAEGSDDGTQDAAPSPIDQAVESQLRKALRRERVQALRQARAQEREARDSAASADDAPPVSATLARADGLPAAPVAIADALPLAPDAARAPADADAADGAPLAHAVQDDADVSPTRDRVEAQEQAQSAPVDDLLASAAASPADAPLRMQPRADASTDALEEATFLRDGGEAAAPARGRAAPWVLCSLLLLVLLAVQALRHERDAIAARQPSLVPALEALCRATGCELSALRRIDAIRIDATSFTPEREGGGYRLEFTLRNASPVPLAMPSIELSLLDTSERPVVRRVLHPADFNAPAVLGARAERNAALGVALKSSESEPTPGVAGYRVLAFYP